MRINQLEETCSDNEEYTTILESDDATRETEKRTNKWKKQLPVITIVVTLALGLRKMRAELRRRVNAWKELMSFAD